jgi:multiple sugar transport system permease protein
METVTEPRILSSSVVRVQKLRRLAPGKVVLTAFMFALGLTMILPFLWMVSASLKIQIDVFQFPIRWIPEIPQWQNYSRVWLGRYPFYRFYLNSIVVAVAAVAGVLLTSSMGGYAFAKLKFPFKDAIFLTYLAMMMIPPQVLLIPRFIMFNAMGLLDTLIVLIIPFTVSAFGTFLMRQFFEQLPNELSEAAIIDGAGHATIWSRIILPLSRPALLALMIISFIWRWNAYVEPLVYLRSVSKLTIPVGLDFFVQENTAEMNLIMAAAVAATLPLIALFMFTQKYFIRGIVMSGLKG